MIPRITVPNIWKPDAEAESIMEPNARQTHPQYWSETCEIEILSVHFQTNRMRIRHVGEHKDLFCVMDVDADEFIDRLERLLVDRDFD